MCPSELAYKLSRALPPNMMLSEHFSVAELSCRHCGRIYITPTLLEMLEQLRKMVGVPITPNSGYRCPTHNRNIGGSTRSKHCLGMAVDINLPAEYRDNSAGFTDAAEDVALKVMGGFHYYPAGRFVHIDCHPYPPDRRW